MFEQTREKIYNYSHMKLKTNKVSWLYVMNNKWVMQWNAHYHSSLDKSESKEKYDASSNMNAIWVGKQRRVIGTKNGEGIGVFTHDNDQALPR